MTAPITTSPATGTMNLKNALIGTPEQRLKEKKMILITLTNLTDIDVTFTGAWDGKLIKGVIRKIERTYKGFKYTIMREGIKQKQQEEQEELKAKEKLNALKPLVIDTNRNANANATTTNVTNTKPEEANK